MLENESWADAGGDHHQNRLTFFSVTFLLRDGLTLEKAHKNYCCFTVFPLFKNSEYAWNIPRIKVAVLQ